MIPCALPVLTDPARAEFFGSPEVCRNAAISEIHTNYYLWTRAPVHVLYCELVRKNFTNE